MTARIVSMTSTGGVARLEVEGEDEDDQSDAGDEAESHAPIVGSHEQAPEDDDDLECDDESLHGVPAKVVDRCVCTPYASRVRLTCD